MRKKVYTDLPALPKRLLLETEKADYYVHYSGFCNGPAIHKVVKVQDITLPREDREIDHGVSWDSDEAIAVLRQAAKHFLISEIEGITSNSAESRKAIAWATTDQERIAPILSRLKPCCIQRLKKSLDSLFAVVLVCFYTLAAASNIPQSTAVRERDRRRTRCSGCRLYCCVS